MRSVLFGGLCNANRVLRSRGCFYNRWFSLDSFQVTRLLTALFLVFFSPWSVAFVAYDLSVPNVSVDQSGKLVYSSVGAPKLTYPKLQTSVPLTVPPSSVYSNPVRVSVPVSVSMSPARAASALVRLARLSSPIVVGITAVSLLCDLTSICQSSSDPNEWVVKTPGGNVSGDDDVVCSKNPLGTDRYAVFSNGIAHIWTVDGAPPSPYLANHCRKSEAWEWYGVYRQLVSTLPASNERPVLPSDWDSSVDKIASREDRYPDLLTSLQTNGSPVPVSLEVSPVSVTSSPETTVVRDSLGNPVSTQTKTVTTSVTPLSSPTDVEPKVGVTQTVTVKDYGPDGSLSKSTTSTEEPPPPEDTSVEFDNVSDVDLPRTDLAPSLNTQSWGEGSCPPDPSVSVLGRSMVIPVHVVCDYMVQIRGAVILVFALISAYIVVGVSKGAS
jgi:hypothetical protein